MADGVVGVKQAAAPDRYIDNEIVLNDDGDIVYRQRVAVADLDQVTTLLTQIFGAVDDLEVTTEQISVEAGTINLSTDQLETILAAVRDRLPVALDADGGAKVHVQNQPASIEISNDVGNPIPTSRANAFKTRVDTFTGTTNGVTVDCTAVPLDTYAIQVKGTGAAPTTWDVRLEGSLDGTNFSQILQHTNSTGDGAVLYSGAVLSPSLYVRARCADLALGSATNIVATILGAVA